MTFFIVYICEMSVFQFPIHSPEEEIKNLAVLQQKQLELFIKRDDLIHPFISGNKWRKLKYTLEKAYQLNKNHLVSFGGAYSNHILALAAAGAKLGFKTTAFIRGEEVNNEVLALCKIFGMNFIFTDRESYKHKHDLFDKHFRNHQNAFFINEGGMGEEAAKGCQEIIQELQQEYDYIFCAAGTGTTSAGIINELKKQNLKSSFHVVSALKGFDTLQTEIANLLIFPAEYTIHHDYHFGGYAKTKPELIQFIKDFASTTGILTDPVYTGKVVYAIKDLAEKNYFKPQSKILMIHTGGIFGILGMMDKF